MRQHAARALGFIGDGRAIEPLRSASRDPRLAVAQAAHEALEMLSKRRKLP